MDALGYYLPSREVPRFAAFLLNGYLARDNEGRTWHRMRVPGQFPARRNCDSPNRDFGSAFGVWRIRNIVPGGTGLQQGLRLHVGRAGVTSLRRRSEPSGAERGCRCGCLKSSFHHLSSIHALTHLRSNTDLGTPAGLPARDSVDQLESDLRAHLEHVAELDVEVAERLQPTGVLERPGVHGVEPDVTAHAHDLLFGGLVVTRRK